MSVVIVVIVSLATMLGIVVGVPLFLLFMIRNSVQASKYRSMTNSPTVSVRIGYIVVYQIGRKIETIELEGTTEGEAMQDLIKKGIRYDKIISLTKM